MKQIIMERFQVEANDKGDWWAIGPEQAKFSDAEWCMEKVYAPMLNRDRGRKAKASLRIAKLTTTKEIVATKEVQP